MGFMAYELVANPDVQQRLYEEILAMETQLGGEKVSYENIQSLKYLDQVVCETLRMWPPTPVSFQIDIYRRNFILIHIHACLHPR